MSFTSNSAAATSAVNNREENESGGGRSCNNNVVLPTVDVILIQEALRHLDDVYTNDLGPKERALHLALERVRHEERCLVQALQHGAASTTTARTDHRDAHRRRHAEAEARLADALLNASDDDDASSSNSSDEAD